MRSIWLEELGSVGHLIFYIFCAIAALNLVLAIAVVILGCLVSSATPGYSIDFYVGIGSLALVVSVLLQGLDPAWGEQFEYESICQVAPAVLVFALCWFAGGLLLKPCAIIHYHRYTEGASVRKQEWKPNLWMMLLMVIDVIVVLVWVLVHPMKLVRQVPQLADDASKEEAAALELELKNSDVIYQCVGENSSEWKMAVSIVHGVMLLLAAGLVWGAISVSKKRPTHTESNLLSVIIYNVLFCVVAVFMVSFLYETKWATLYGILGGIVMYAVFITLLLLLVAKIMSARRTRSGTDEYYAEVDDNAGSSFKGSNNYQDNVPPPPPAFPPTGDVFTY